MSLRTLNFKLKSVESEAEWSAVRAIRQRVFIDEQNCPPAEEFDGHDARSRHVIGLLEDEPMATARWRVVVRGEELVAKLERFAVLPSHRGHGYGRTLVRYMIDHARKAGFDVQYLHAQTHLEDFYADFGFKRQGEPFTEAGIPHVAMLRRGEGR